MVVGVEVKKGGNSKGQCLCLQSNFFAFFFRGFFYYFVLGKGDGEEGELLVRRGDACLCWKPFEVANVLFFILFYFILFENFFILV